MGDTLDKAGVAKLWGKIKKYVSDNIPTSITGNAATATKLRYTRYINGLGFDGSSSRNSYASCGTSGSTATKTVSITGFSLVTGAEVTIRFTNANTAANPTLNVSSTGAKAIYYKNAAIPANYIKAGTVLQMRYGGSYWYVVGEPTQAQVDELKTNVSGLIKVSTLTLAAMSLDAEWDGQTTGTVPAMTGYTPVLVTPKDSGASDVCWISCVMSGTTVTAKLKNTTTVAKTGFTPSVNILYFKNS